MKVSPVPAAASPVRAPLLHRPGDEPLPGYRLIAPLGRGPTGEVWKCEAPGGVLKALKVIAPGAGGAGRGSPDAEALRRVRAARHPGLLFLDRVKTAGDCLVVVMELADKSLRQVLTEWQATGAPGVPRDLLLGYLREAAEALDGLAARDLDHLNLKPENLLLAAGRLKVGDFGLAARRRSLLGEWSPYAAPELRLGIASRASDQYSLALLYHELLTGILPREAGDVDLGALPPGDRVVVRRALSSNPQDRFHSCLGFVEALTGQLSTRAEDTPRPARALPPLGAGRSAEGTRLGVPSREEPSLCQEPAATPGAGSCSSLPGYRFLSCLARREAGETWVVLLPDGRTRHARLIHGLGDQDPGRVAETVRRLTQVRDPALPRYERAVHDGTRIILIVEPPGPSLRQRLADCRAQRLSGILRPELLASLADAAGSLDRLHEAHGVEHGMVNPDNLVLQRGRVVLLDYGVAPLLSGPEGRRPDRFNPRYAAPELAEGQGGRAGDIYSLAVTYWELLTGLHPWTGRGRGRERRAARGKELLPAADRAVLARALHEDPRRRFATCGELVQALEEATPRREKEPAPADRLPSVIAWPCTRVEPAHHPAPAVPTLAQLLPDLLAHAAGPLRVQEYQNVRFLVQPGDCLHYRCAAWLPPPVARLKLESFLQQWQAEADHCDDTRLVCRIALPSGLWDRCLGRQAGLEVGISLRHAQPPVTRLTEVRVQVRGLGRAGAGRLLAEVGPLVLESLRAHLQACPEQRGQPRLTCAYPVRMAPVQSGLHLASPVECRSKDISEAGIGLLLPEQPTSPQVYLNVAGDDRAAALGVLARIVRVQPRDDGWYEVGAAFPSPQART